MDQKLGDIRHVGHCTPLQAREQFGSTKDALQLEEAGIMSVRIEIVITIAVPSMYIEIRQNTFNHDTSSSARNFGGSIFLFYCDKRASSSNYRKWIKDGTVRIHFTFIMKMQGRASFENKLEGQNWHRTQYRLTQVSLLQYKEMFWRSEPRHRARNGLLAQYILSLIAAVNLKKDICQTVTSISIVKLRAVHFWNNRFILV